MKRGSEVNRTSGFGMGKGQARIGICLTDSLEPTGLAKLGDDLRSGPAPTPGIVYSNPRFLLNESPSVAEVNLVLATSSFAQTKLRK